jgi:hypothetical protein
MLLLVFLAAAAVLGIFIVPVLLTQRHSARAQETFVSSGRVMPKVIQNSTIAYGIGLVTFVPLLVWGVGGAFWPAIVYVGFVGLGLSLIYVLRRPLLEFLAAALSDDRSITVHEFIARRHGDDPRVRAVAAALTVFAVSGFILCEMLGVATVLKPLLWGSAGLAELFIAAVFLVVMACTIFAGHTGIMHAAQLQFGLLYFGLFGSTACLLYLQVSEFGLMPSRGMLAVAFIPIVGAVIYFRRRVRYVDTNPIRYADANAGAAVRAKEPLSSRLLSRFQKVLNTLVAILAMTSIVLAIAFIAMVFYIEGVSTAAGDSVTAAGSLVSNSSVSNVMLISLILLPLFHPIVDIVNWQRLAAFAKNRDWSQPDEGQWAASFKSFCTAYAVEVPLMGLFICLFGAVAGLTLATPISGDVVQAFVERLVAQENFMATAVLFFLLFSLFSMAVSLMGSLFSAGLCAIRYDVMPMFSPVPTSAPARAAKDEWAARRTAIAGLGIGLATFLAFHIAGVGFAITFASTKFLGLVFGFSSAQLSLVPLVLGPLVLGPLVAGTGGVGTLSPGWALAVMVVGSAIGIGVAAVLLVAGNESWLSFVVPAGLGSAALLFVVGRLLHRRTAAAS